MKTRQWLVMLGVMGIVGLVGSAYAVLTEAGTEIRNQSVATYVDAASRPQVSTSNEVITTVLPIYALEITPNKSGGTDAPFNFANTPALAQSAAPGNTVYYSYYLQNQGNATDTFQLKYSRQPAGAGVVLPTDVKIYQDVNGDGNVDPGDRLLNSNAGDNAFGANATFGVAANSSITLIVAVIIPTNAAAADTVGVDLNAQSVGDVTKSDAISNWSRTTVTNIGLLTAVKSVNVTDAAAGATLIYTLQGSNTGNADVYGKNLGAALVDLSAVADTAEQRSGVLVTDTFSDVSKLDRTTLTAGAFSPATATVVYLKGAVWQKQKPAAVDILGIGLFIPDTLDTDALETVVLNPGQGYSLQFSVNVAAGVTDSVIPNSYTVVFDNNTNTGDTAPSTTSNTVNTVVGGATSVVPGVKLGPGGDPTLDGNLDGRDASGDKEAAYTDLLGDIAEAGQTISFTNTVRNTGNKTDTMNITIVSNSTLGTVLLYKSDGLTPLADTNLDAIPDTGPLAPGADADFVVKVLLPANHAGGGNITAPPNYLVQLRATTTNKTLAGATDQNDTYDVIGQIRPAGVDIATTGQTGDGDNTSGDDYPAIQSTNPGTFKDFPLDVQNKRTDNTVTGAVDTYNMTVSGLLTGWLAVFYKDLNGDGVLNPAELVPVTNTGDLDISEIQKLIVRVYVPDGQAPVTAQAVTITATSTNNATIFDAVDLRVTVNSAPALVIVPDNSAVGVRGGTMTYRHVVTNVGNLTETLNLTAVSALGWGYTFVKADGTNLGQTPTVEAYYGGNLPPGASQEVYLKVFVPGNAAVGATDVMTVTVANVGLTASDSAVDNTTVIDGNLQLTKTTSVATVKPTLASATVAGDFHPIKYTTTYKNLGTADISNVYVYDAIPANSRMVVDTNAGLGLEAPAGGSAIAYSNNGGSTYAYTPVAAADHTDAAVTHIRWTILGLGAVVPGASGTVTFQVLVK